MDQRAALNQTIKLFDIKASQLSTLSGVGENQISRFRQGKASLYAETLQAIVNALPDQARAYYYMLLLSNGSNHHKDVAS